MLLSVSKQYLEDLGASLESLPFLGMTPWKSGQGGEKELTKRQWIQNKIPLHSSSLGDIQPRLIKRNQSFHLIAIKAGELKELLVIFKVHVSLGLL